MNSMGISTDPALLNVELPHTLVESASVSTFLAEEEASICPLLSNTIGPSTPHTFSHPLTPCVDIDSTTSGNLCNEDAKADTSSSSGSSSGIGMDAPDNTGTTTLFNKHAYQYLQHNSGAIQDVNGNGPNGNLTHSKETPSFVSWNWPLIRKCTFFTFMSSLLAMCAVVVAMIITLPKTCNPRTAWYHGSVFYEIFPASFQDSNNDGFGDIRGIQNRVDYFATLGIAAVRLNSIFPSLHYPYDYENITTLTEVADVLGGLNDVFQLAEALHDRNISLILDLPINLYVDKLEKVTIAEEEKLVDKQSNNSATVSFPSATVKMQDINKNIIIEAITKWIEMGVDGFYIKGLETFVDDNNLINNLVEWRRVIGRNRVLIISELVINNIEENKKKLVLAEVDLVDVHLDVLHGTKYMEERIKTVLSGDLAPLDNTAWIHWSIASVQTERITQHLSNENVTFAATIMQLMLPGTPSIFYGDEIAVEGATNPRNEHAEGNHLQNLPVMQWSNKSFQFTDRETLPWLPQKVSYSFENFKIISNMIELRDRSPSIYKNAICKMHTTLPNTQIHRSHDDILVVERVYPRRNSFVSVSNFGQKNVTMDLTALYYSGLVMLKQDEQEKVYFGNFEIGPLETIVIKLDK